MATPQDWFVSYVFQIGASGTLVAPPGTGTGDLRPTDVHNMNCEIYTATREFIVSTWWHLVPGFTDQWYVTLTLENDDHTGSAGVAEAGFAYPLGDSDDGSGATGAYQGPFVLASNIIGFYEVPGVFVAGLHEIVYQEKNGQFMVRLDGIDYDLTPAQGAPRTNDPYWIATTAEAGWDKSSVCAPFFTGDCIATYNPRLPQASLGVTSFSAGKVVFSPVLFIAPYIDIMGVGFDPSGLFWTDFNKTFET